MTARGRTSSFLPLSDVVALAGAGGAAGGAAVSTSSALVLALQCAVLLFVTDMYILALPAGGSADLVILGVAGRSRP